MLPYQAQWLTEWFDEYEKDVNYLPWNSQSPDFTGFRANY